MKKNRVLIYVSDGRIEDVFADWPDDLDVVIFKQKGRGRTSEWLNTGGRPSEMSEVEEAVGVELEYLFHYSKEEASGG